MLCKIWYHLYNLNCLKRKTCRGVLLVKSKASTCNFTKSNTPPWVFFMFPKLFKWYQIKQSSGQIVFDHFVGLALKRFIKNVELSIFVGDKSSSAISAQCCISYRNQSFILQISYRHQSFLLQIKTKWLFLNKMQHCTEMG